MMRILPSGIAALALFVMVPVGCGDKIEPGNQNPEALPAVAAPVAAARMTSLPLTYPAVGTVHPVASSTIASKLMGTVREFRVKEGDRVRQGEILVVIDKRQVSAQLRQAQAALAEARRAESAARSARDAAAAGAQLAQATYERYLRLQRDDSVSRQEFDEIEARRRQASASLEQSEQMLAAARHRVQQVEAGLSAAGVVSDDAAIAAPYDGTVTAKMSEVGDLAAPGTPLLVVESVEGHRVDVVLPEAYVETVRQGQPVTVRVPALGDRILEGTVQTVVPAADQTSRSFLVKIRIAADGALRSGMFARVDFTIGERRVMRIPDRAVVRQGQLTGIFVVGEDGVARFRLVRTGSRFDDTVEIVTGLDDGQRFVAAPPPTLADGARVEALP